MFFKKYKIMATDFTTSILKMRNKLTKPCLISALVLTIASVVLMVNGLWGTGITCIVIAFLATAFAVVINGLYVIMPGHSGYKITLGKMANRSYPAGFGWMIPFVSTMTEVDITKQTHKDVNTMKNQNRRDITLTYVLTWNLDPSNVHTLHATIGEDNYVAKALCPQLDACMTNIIAQETYDTVNGALKELSEKIMDEFVDLYDDKLFQNVKLNIVEVKFDQDYEEAVAKAAKVEMERKIIAEQAEQLKISAQAKADALRIEAEAEADALRIKGTSENEIRKALGKILERHPELIKEELAKNFPKVFGGNSIINLNDILGK